MFLCLSVLRLEDINHAGMEKVYYYSRITKHCIEKTVYDIGYQEIFPGVSSPDNIWNMSDDKRYEEES